MYDIIAMIWYLRRFHCKFESKKRIRKESISFNLRHGGSVLIDRKDSKQAIPAGDLGVYRKTQPFSSYFPEGTRSRTGKPSIFANRF
jgi:1-acyl-sn-glycerol-3-phosphate acyltransferase